MKATGVDSRFVVLSGVSKRYSDVLALDGISFEIKEGEIFGYIGPNGAGKTTTMKILTGLVSDFEGEASVRGYRMPERRDEIHRLLGYLPQNVAFQEWRTVDQALRTFGKLSGLEERNVSSRISEVLDALSLSDVRNKKISQLSGGTVQKVGLAQALLHNPQLLILDEPLAGLDPTSRHQLKEIIKKLGKDKTTVFFSSHILSDVQDVATRIGIINQGRMMQIGTLDELRTRFPARNDVEIALSYERGDGRDLDPIKGVKGLERPYAGKLVVHLDDEADADEAIHNVIQALIKSGNRIRSVIPMFPTLDDVYLEYVEGEMK